MPRQPYPKSLAEPVYGIGQVRAMAKIAEAVGRCIMAWSYVDWQMAVMLAAIMKAESDASIAIFLTLRNARAQRDVLVAAADTALQGEDREIFDAIMHVYASLQSQRADIAHGVFGLAPELNDGAAWIETRHLSKRWVDKFYRSKAVDAIASSNDEARLRDTSSIYKTADLDRLEESIRELWATAFHFTNSLGPLKDAAYKSELAKLCTLPQMALALAQTRNPKRNPSPQ